MKNKTKITTLSVLTLIVTLMMISGCIVNNNTTLENSRTFYNENNKENYFTLYTHDNSFIYIELKKDGGHTFDLSKVGTYKIEEKDIFLTIPQGIVLRGKFANETIIIDSEGTKWTKE